MTTAADSGDADAPAAKSAPQQPRRHVLLAISYLVFLAIPLIATLSLALFKSGWQVRVDEIKAALCESFWPIADADDEDASGPSCADVAEESLELMALPLMPEVPWLNVRYEVVLTAPEVFAYPDAALRPTAEAPEPRCSELNIATFDLVALSTSQDATYDSIARRIEACTQRAADVTIVKLCTGTRSALGAQTCRMSLDFLDAMQRFDRTTAGSAANIKLILANVSFGVFQFAALLLMLIGLYRAIHRRLDTQAPPDPAASAKIDQGAEFAPTVRTSARDAAYHARTRAQGEDEQKRLQSYLLYKDAYRTKVSSAFQRINNLGDIIVLIGLLGTLWGMLILFSALAESGSAEPLTAELAKSNMLGSLGLAFGTTIFAGVLRLIYVLIIPRLQADAEDTIDQVFVEQLSDVDFNVFGASVPDNEGPLFPRKRSLIETGMRVMQRAMVRKQRAEFDFQDLDPRSSSFGLFAAAALLIILITVAAMIFLGNA